MKFLEWLLGSREAVCGGKDRLQKAVARVIAGTDPRLGLIDDAPRRLCPAVTHALDYADRVAASLPACIETTPAAWGGSPVLRAMFVRPTEVGEMLTHSLDLHDFLSSPAAAGLERLYCVVAATRTEQTVLGLALEGERVRQDVQQTTVSFESFRLFGFASSEQGLRGRIAEIVLEGLVLAALREVAARQQQGDRLAFARRLLSGRLALMERSRAGLDAMECGSYRGRDIARLRTELAANEAELNALQPAGGSLETILAGVIETLQSAETVIRAEMLSLWLDRMNILTRPGQADASPIPLLEFSAATSGRRRVAFLASFPRESVVERKLDLEAGLRML